MDAVALQHVEKSYTSYSSEIVITGQTRQSRTRQVLRDLSVRFAIGQHTVLVGRSGCGKSTLLKLLAGKEQPDAGQIDMPQAQHIRIKNRKNRRFPHGDRRFLDDGDQTFSLTFAALPRRSRR